VEINKLRIKYIVTDHREERGVHVLLLAMAHAINRRAHIVIDAASRDAFKHSERMPVGVEQHLMGLQQIGAQQKGPAVRQLDMGHLKLDALNPDMGPALTPIELERLTRLKYQRHECSSICRAMRARAVAFPVPHEGRDPFIGAIKAKLHQIGMHLPDRPTFLA